MQNDACFQGCDASRNQDHAILDRQPILPSSCFAHPGSLYYFTVAGLSWPYLMAASLAGYFLADFSSGAVHWAMDTWFDERTMGRAIAITREHHTHPDHVYGFLENASFGSAPSAVVVRPCR